MEYEKRHTEQARRIIFAFKQFLIGKTFTVKEIHNLISNHFQYNVSLRTIQRDLRVLQDCVPLLEQWKEGKQVYWKLANDFIKINGIPKIESSELFSFHILKAFLKSFKGTSIEKEVFKLEKKLEKYAPGNAFYSECLFWDQNFGTYDYSNYNYILEHVINNITKKKWVHIDYHSTKQNTDKSYDCFFQGIFSYSGILYVVTYFPYFKKHEALALHGIKNIDSAYKSYNFIPDFDFQEFTKNRFGVFSSKPFEIKLKVKKKYIEYFLGRRWHKSQKESFDKQGNLIIELKVPIGMDLVSWIIGWNEAIKVIKPKVLREKVINKLELGLRNYKK